MWQVPRGVRQVQQHANSGVLEFCEGSFVRRETATDVRFDQIEDFGGLLVGHEPTLCGLDDSVFYLTKRAFGDGEEAREFGVGAARETFGDITCHGSRGASQLIDQVAIAGNRGRFDEVRDARAELVRELIAD